MITAWILSFSIDCGFMCFNTVRGLEFKSKEDCYEQVEMIRDVAKDNDNTVDWAYCSPRYED